MGIERIEVTVIDQIRAFAEAEFNIPLVLGTTTDPEAVKDTLKIYSANDLAAVAEDFPVTTSEYKTVAKIMAQDPHPGVIYVYSKTRSATPVVTDLSAALLAAKTAVETQKLVMFYFVVPTEHEELEGDTEEMMDTVAAMECILVTTNKTGKTATQIRAHCAELNSDRIVMGAHKDETERLDAGIAGYWGGMPVGSLTLDTKPLNNVSASNWTSSELATLLANTPGVAAAIPYVDQAGVAVTVGSWTTNGSFADMRRAKDWLKAKFKEAIFGLKLQNPKIPQTQHGANMIQGAIEGVLNRALSMGIVQQRGSIGRWEIEIPTLEWLAKNDSQALARRWMRTIRVRVWPVGAWEVFTILVYVNWEMPS